MFFALLIFSLLGAVAMNPVTAKADEEKPDISKVEFPKPEAPVYLVFEGADRTAKEGSDALYVVRKADMSVMELSAEYEADRDAFMKKYGLYSFCLVMQYDTSVDGTDNWNYTADWDKDYSAQGTHEASGIFWLGTDMMSKENVFDLYYRGDSEEKYNNMADAIIKREVPDGDSTFTNYYFDHENHNLSVRVRYYMEWETYDGEIIGEKQSKFGEWSDVAVFGKDGNAVTPEKPEGYEAPVISDLKHVFRDDKDENGHLEFMQVTPESTWMAGIYYVMTGDGSFEGLETEISVNDSDWQTYNAVNSGGDWCLRNGLRTASYEEPALKEGDHIKLRVRFIGSEGPSQWSNVIEINGEANELATPTPEESPVAEESKKPEVSEEPKEEDEKCSLCGFCPQPLGLCIFIWIVIVVVVVIIIVVVAASKKNKKDKK